MRCKRYISGLLLLLALVAFAGCRQWNQQQQQLRANRNVNRTEQTVIRFMGQWFEQGDRERFIREFVTEYNFRNQHVRVELIFPEEIMGDRRGDKDLEVFVTEQLRSRVTDYDILLLNNDYALVADEPGWAKKYLVDFSEIPQFRETTVQGLINDSIIGLWGGIIPGPLVEGFYYTLWCNTNVANQVGVEVKQMGMTFDDFRTYIQAVHTYNEKQTNPDDRKYALFEAGDWRTMNYLTNQLYMSILNDDAEFFRDRPSERKLRAWNQTLQLLQTLAPYKPLDPQYSRKTWNDSFHEFLDDKYLFFINGSWMYSFWQNVDRQKLMNMMPVELPVTRLVNNYIGGYQIMWGVPKNAPNRDEAVKFLLAMNDARVAEKWVRYTKCPTGIQGKLATVSMGVDHFEDFTFQIDQKYGKNKINPLGSQYVFGFNNRWNHYFAHEVLLGEITPTEALRQIRAALSNNNVNIVP